MSSDDSGGVPDPQGREPPRKDVVREKGPLQRRGAQGTLVGNPVPFPVGDAYLTRQQAAEYLGVSVRWLEAESSIPKHNFARPTSKKPMWRYRRGELDSFWTNRRTGALGSGGQK